MRRALPVMVASLLAALSALSACSVVDDGKVSSIDPPGGLDETLPPTTSTTTTLPESSTTGLDTPTTLLATEPVRLYFILSGQLVYVTVPLAAPAEPAGIISALQIGPPAEALGYRTAVPADAPIQVRTDGSGIARVFLPDEFFDQVSTTDQQLVIGQIVLTLTDSRGIGQVIFNKDVTKPPLGALVPAGQPLTKLDYEALSDSSPTPVEAATNTSASSTSEA